jgi:predicted  nucleic acid-binding Zn-ribbon protein
MRLDQRTLIIGPNTSHKSSVVQAVELALTGAADDLLGRSEVKDGATILSMSPSRELSCDAHLNNDDHYRYHVNEIEGTVKKPTHHGNPDFLPLRSVRNALRGSAATARKEFFKWVVSDISEILEDINDNDLPPIKDAAGVLQRLTYLSKKCREVSSQIKGAKSVAEDLRHGLIEPVEEEEIAALESMLAEAQNKPADIERQVADIKASRNEWIGRLAQLRDECGDLEAYNGVATLLNVAIFTESDNCPACSSVVGKTHLEVCRDHYQMLVSENQALIDQLNDALTTVARLDAELERLKRLNSNTSDADAIRERLMVLRQQQADWNSMKRANESVTQMEADLARYKHMKNRCEYHIKAAIESNIDFFVARVNKFLPASWSFGIILHDSGRDVFRVGLNTLQGFHSALSGVEWATVTAAVSMAITQNTLEEDDPAVIILEDRAWDGSTLAAVMRAYANFDGQVIIASTVRPRGRPSKGWKIIDLDKTPLVEEEAQVVPIKLEPEAKADVITRKGEHTCDGDYLTGTAVAQLESLGWSREVIRTLTFETAGDIVAQRVPQDSAVIDEDGNLQITTENILDLPRLT